MVKLVDMPDLGSGAARRVGSSPIIRTKSPNESLGFFCGFRTRSLSRFIGKDYCLHEKPKRKFGLFYFKTCRTIAQQIIIFLST
jgi:hypothetical protein